MDTFRSMLRYESDGGELVLLLSPGAGVAPLAAAEGGRPEAGVRRGRTGGGGLVVVSHRGVQRGGCWLHRSVYRGG